jgi:competence ComEA-like helix-hairpin-helix protein
MKNIWKNLLPIFSDQPVLCLAFLCSLLFLLHGLGFVHWVTNHELQIKSREPRFYIELSKPDEFPVTLGLNKDDELRHLALLYRVEKLRNGDKLVLNDAGSISLSRISGKKCLALGIPIGINSAGIEDLDALPGIGPNLAERIVEYRNLNGPFKTINGLRNVDGIGEKKYGSIKPFINLD